MADTQNPQNFQNPINSLLAEFGTRLNEIEEKQRIIKDRVLLIGENLIATKEESEKEYSDFKKQITELNSEIRTIKQLNTRILSELNNLARKSEVEILERQFKMFEPLKFTTINDVKKIVQEELKKQNK
ncbi:hypothetical protein HOD75_02370 [archaeon]|nr:hypothetical protein [archaeon]MBT4241723.1 hypothetical protein [archaeon]MBT4418271.1 hypothetical protein [archaeon]